MPEFCYLGHRLHYTDQGAGTPLLLLHGNAASSNMFYGTAQRYAASFRVICPDFLGHGASDRLSEFPTDLWFEEARQVIALLRALDLGPAHLIGTSGGALTAINVALEAPELVRKVIADSFEGDHSLEAVTSYLAEEREASKQDENARQFFRYMHGEDWEGVVDNDTAAVLRHHKEIGRFFHRPLSELRADILLTGSLEDEFLLSMASGYMEKTYQNLLTQIGHGSLYLFPSGGHPAMFSSSDDFYRLSLDFLNS